MTFTAKAALLVRPNVLGQCRFLVAARLPLTPSRPSTVTVASSYNLSCAPLLSPSRFSFSSLPTRAFCIRAAATPDNSASAESALIDSMEKKIKDRLSADSVVVKDAYGDGRHVSIDVVSSVFEGQSAVNRQRMVYKAIWEELQDKVHAVDQMTTKTPSEANTVK